MAWSASHDTRRLCPSREGRRPWPFAAISAQTRASGRSLRPPGWIALHSMAPTTATLCRRSKLSQLFDTSAHLPACCSSHLGMAAYHPGSPSPWSVMGAGLLPERPAPTVSPPPSDAALQRRRGARQSKDGRVSPRVPGQVSTRQATAPVRVSSYLSNPRRACSRVSWISRRRSRPQV